MHYEYFKPRSDTDAKKKKLNKITYNKKKKKCYFTFKSFNNTHIYYFIYMDRNINIYLSIPIYEIIHTHTHSILYIYGSIDKYLYLYVYVQKYILNADTCHHLPSFFIRLGVHDVIKSHATWQNTSQRVGKDFKRKEPDSFYHHCVTPLYPSAP